MIKPSDAPILTIIVPIYNSEEYLAKCLDSLVNHSLEETELLLVNDQSTDDSELIMKNYAKHNAAIRIFSTDTKSLAGGTRNVGLQHARGKYIGFVDSDDWIDSNMYAKMVALLEKSEADIAICGVVKEYDNAINVYYKYTYDFENIIDGSFALELLARRNNQDIAVSPIACNKVYSTAFLKRNQLSFLSNNYCEDDVFNYIAFLNASRVAITPNAYYHYYQRNNSITHSFSRKHIDDLLEAFNFIMDYLVKNDLFEKHKGNFFAFFERCSAFVLNLLTLKENDVTIQNKYLQYFLLNGKSILYLPEYLEYCGVHRVQQFFNPQPIK